MFFLLGKESYQKQNETWTLSTSASSTPLHRQVTEASKWEDQVFFKTQNLMEEINGRPWSSGTQLSSISLHSNEYNCSQIIFIGKITNDFSSLLKLPLLSLWPNIISHCVCHKSWMGFLSLSDHFDRSRDNMSEKELNNSPTHYPIPWFYYLFIYLAAPGLSCSTRDLRCDTRNL